MSKEVKPLISILLATYNGEKYLYQQVQSLLDQTYGPIEIIVSDDGSIDNTISIITDFQKNNNNILLVKNTRHGIANNFVNAYNNSNGTYLAFCDQDDYWMPEKIELLVQAIGDRSLVYHNSLFIDDNGKSLGKTIADKVNCYSGNDPLAFLLQNSVSGHACLCRRELMDKAIPFPKARFHDWWLAYVAAATDGVIYLPEVLVHYRQHADSKTDILTNKKDYKHIKEWEKYTEEIEWYKRCVSLETAHLDFIKKWYVLYQQKETRCINFQLFLMGIKNRKTLYSMNKKGGISVLFECLKLLWGIPVKRLL
jgi:glycosyltransferase involved in cell wall biosynthesis